MIFSLLSAAEHRLLAPHAAQAEACTMRTWMQSPSMESTMPSCLITSAMFYTTYNLCKDSASRAEMQISTSEYKESACIFFVERGRDSVKLNLFAIS
jgi:hypothetical protein